MKDETRLLAMYEEFLNDLKKTDAFNLDVAASRVNMRYQRSHDADVFAAIESGLELDITRLKKKIKDA